MDKLDPETVGLGIGVLLCGLSVRLVISYISVLGGDVNHRYCIFLGVYIFLKTIPFTSPLAPNILIEGLFQSVLLYCKYNLYENMFI